jgi:hypothetical protein
MKKINIKNALLFSSLFFSSLILFGQDTIVYVQGNVRYGRVVDVDNSGRFIVFDEKNTRSIISMENLKSFTKNDLDSSFQKNDYLTKNVLPPSEFTKKMGASRELMSQGYGKYSFGLNFIALINPNMMGNFDFLSRTYSTNQFVDIFFQFETSPKVALRFPLRIGLNPLSQEVVFSQGDPNHYWRGQYMREFVGDLGFEPVFYFLGIHKMTWFVSPGLSVGIGRVVSRQQFNLSSEEIEAIYTPKGNTVFTRQSINLGFQYFMTKNLQFEMTSGFFLSNNNRWSFYSDDLSNRRFLGSSLRVALVYRFD